MTNDETIILTSISDVMYCKRRWYLHTIEQQNFIIVLEIWLLIAIFAVYFYQVSKTINLLIYECFY